MDAKTLCLAVLERGDASGYEIKKALEEPPLVHFQDTSFGSIYPALTKLTREGLVRGTDFPQKNRPDKKVYTITAAGRARLSEALSEPPGPDRFRSDFLFALFLGHLLPDGRLQEVIAERIDFYEAQVARMEGCDLAGLPPSQQLVHGFGLALHRAAADYLRANRDRVEDPAGLLRDTPLMVAE